MIVILYRPPASSPVTFLGEFADIIERTAVYSAPLIVLGDINIHIDNAQASTTAKFTNILSDFDLVQHVTGPTHTGGHTLDVFIMRSGMQPQVTVEPPIISDHSMVTATIKFDNVGWTETQSAIRRCWRSFDIDAFKTDLMSSDLVVNPPDYTATSSSLCTTEAHVTAGQARAAEVDNYSSPPVSAVVQRRLSANEGENSAIGGDLSCHPYRRRSTAMAWSVRRAAFDVPEDARGLLAQDD